jgi:uncharacterized membrane protein YccF (DUF307 family)
MLLDTKRYLEPRINAREVPMTDNRVKSSFRDTLADSHVSAVAIVVLLFWSLDSGLRALWNPLSSIVEYLTTAVAILGIPFGSAVNHRTLVLTWFGLFSALVSFASAGLLSRWIYGVGPLRALGKYRASLAWKHHV